MVGKLQIFLLLQLLLWTIGLGQDRKMPDHHYPQNVHWPLVISSTDAGPAIQINDHILTRFWRPVRFCKSLGSHQIC
ncbi:hypothetical protein OIU85_013722 [Salix viminalis]|uniref:Plastocyanin-like domain-containing protein n=1 Tax=Salix viminalis TaxID=40686 RepID=A0A9Q0NMK8_SALVM|nr:hypothetical protein OIU85_013722 [Salix viminalis]